MMENSKPDIAGNRKLLPSLASRQDFQAKLTQNRTRKEKKKVKPIKTVSLTLDRPDAAPSVEKHTSAKATSRTSRNSSNFRDSNGTKSTHDVTNTTANTSKSEFSGVPEQQVSVQKSSDAPSLAVPLLQLDKLNEECQRFMSRDADSSSEGIRSSRSSQNALPTNVTINLYLNNDGATLSTSHGKVANTHGDVQISQNDGVISISQPSRPEKSLVNKAPDILVIDEPAEEQIDDDEDEVNSGPSLEKRRRSYVSQYGESITDDVFAEFQSLSEDALYKKRQKQQELRSRLGSLSPVRESVRLSHQVKVEQWLSQMQEQGDAEDSEDEDADQGLDYSQASATDSVFGNLHLEPAIHPIIHPPSGNKPSTQLRKALYSVPLESNVPIPKTKPEIFRRMGAKDPLQLVMMNSGTYDSVNPDDLSGKPPTPHAWEPHKPTLPPLTQDNIHRHNVKQGKQRHRSLSPVQVSEDQKENRVRVENGIISQDYSMQGQPHWKRATIDTHISVAALRDEFHQMPHPPTSPAKRIVAMQDASTQVDAATQVDDLNVAMDTGRVAHQQSQQVQSDSTNHDSISYHINPAVDTGSHGDSGFCSSDENSWEMNEQEVYLAYLQTENGAIIGPFKLELDSLELGLPTLKEEIGNKKANGVANGMEQHSQAESSGIDGENNTENKGDVNDDHEQINNTYNQANCMPNATAEPDNRRTENAGPDNATDSSNSINESATDDQTNYDNSMNDNKDNIIAENLNNKQDASQGL